MGEIDKLIPSFRAIMATEVIKHRVVTGINQVPAFIADINKHRDRYFAKLDCLRASTNAIAECDATQRAINDIADYEITRARTNGSVEFPDLVDHARTVLVSHMKRHGT